MGIQKHEAPILSTIITNPEGPRPQETPILPPDPGKPSLLRRPCMYLTRYE